MAKLSQKQQQQIFLAALLLVGGIYVYWAKMLKPTIADLKDKRAKLESLHKEIERAQQQARRLPALKAEKEQLSTELAKLEKQLPKSKDLPSIIRILTTEALQENLEFSQLSPKPSVPQQYFEVIPFDIRFMGSLGSLARFFASLGQNERIFKFQNVTLSPSNAENSLGGDPNLNINFTMETYAYTGAS